MRPLAVLFVSPSQACFSLLAGGYWEVLWCTFKNLDTIGHGETVGVGACNVLPASMLMLCFARTDLGKRIKMAKE